jgi:predicted lipoprotein
MKRLERILPILLIMIILFVFLFGACTIKKIGEADDEESDEFATWTKTGKKFDPVQYVDSIWDERLIPVFMDESVDISTVLSALEEDREAAIEEYGYIKETMGTDPAFKVKGEAKVLEYDTSSRNGLFILDLPPADGAADVELQVGPVIRGTAIRDSVGFISFSDVGNQIQFANLADELNARMKEKVVQPLGLENTEIEGKTISFHGTFKLAPDQKLENIVITPLRIDVSDGSPGDEE